MKLLKFITPFIFTFPGWMVLAFMTWLGKFTGYNLAPQKAVLFVAMGFTMLILDLFLKYLIGKGKIGYVWVIEIALFITLAIMILPRLQADIYV